MRYSLVALSLSLSCLGASAQTPPADAHPHLPPGPGRELVLRTCSKCHEPELAADQQLDAAGWKELVDQMAGNGAQATDAEFDQIISYLNTSFGKK